jgi:hypothetical protein
MPKLELKEVTQYVEGNIGDFHKRLLETLNDLSLTVVLFKKNPYLFKAKAFTNAADIVKSLVDAFLSSREETIFGNWLEGLAIFINSKVYSGKKSTTPGVDLEFDKDGTRYIVAIKSGPNWGNSSQIRKMVLDFNTARRTLTGSIGHQKNPLAVIFHFVSDTSCLTEGTIRFSIFEPATS